MSDDRDAMRGVRGSPVDDDRVLFVGTYCRGQRRMDEERDYLENYLPTDERARRVGRPMERG